MATVAKMSIQLNTRLYGSLVKVAEINISHVSAWRSSDPGAPMARSGGPAVKLEVEVVVSGLPEPRTGGPSVLSMPAVILEVEEEVVIISGLPAL